MNETLLTILIALAIPAVALVVIAMESRWTARISAQEPDALVALLPAPTPVAIDPTRKARLNASFKTH